MIYLYIQMTGRNDCQTKRGVKDWKMFLKNSRRDLFCKKIPWVYDKSNRMSPASKQTRIGVDPRPDATPSAHLSGSAPDWSFWSCWVKDEMRNFFGCFSRLTQTDGSWTSTNTSLLSFAINKMPGGGLFTWKEN